jgi:hypothetical protein
VPGIPAGLWVGWHLGVLDEGSTHSDRDAQFGYINAQTSAALAAGQPAISVDTKKELVGAPRDKPVGMLQEWRQTDRAMPTVLRQTGSAQERPRHRPVHLVLDGLPAHKTTLVKTYAASTKGSDRRTARTRQRHCRLKAFLDERCDR